MAIGGKQSKASAKGQKASERISNRLNRTLVAENRQRLGKKQLVTLLVVVLVTSLVALGAYFMFRKSDAPTIAPAENPYQGQETDWAPMFHWKSKGQE